MLTGPEKSVSHEVAIPRNLSLTQLPQIDKKNRGPHTPDRKGNGTRPRVLPVATEYRMTIFLKYGRFLHVAICIGTGYGAIVGKNDPLPTWRAPRETANSDCCLGWAVFWFDGQRY
jgi:hypothetical protein